MTNLKNLYKKYRPSIVRIVVRDRNGDFATGTGFHIGDGLIVTARHVMRESIRLSDFGGQRYEETDMEVISITREVDKHELTVTATYLHIDEKVDLALLETDMEIHPFQDSETGRNLAKGYMAAIPLGASVDQWLKDHLILSKVLVMGYPKIPRARESFLVTTEAEINSLVHGILLPHPYYVLSSMARGGFSGAPVISEEGEVIGVIVESLYGDHKPEETGFNSAITIEPLVRILADRGARPRWIAVDIWDRFSS